MKGRGLTNLRRGSGTCLTRGRQGFRWDQFAQPIQVSELSRGLEHNASFDIAKQVRSLAFDLTRDHNQFTIAKQFITVLKEVFAEVDKIAEWLADDTNALEFMYTLQRGYAKFNNNDYESAISDFERALRLNPDSAYVYGYRGLAKVELGRSREAIVDFDQALRTDPSLANVYLGRGMAKENLGYFQEANADYAQAVQLEPEFAELFSSRQQPWGYSGY